MGMGARLAEGAPFGYGSNKAIAENPTWFSQVAPTSFAAINLSSTTRAAETLKKVSTTPSGISRYQ